MKAFSILQLAKKKIPNNKALILSKSTHGFELHLLCGVRLELDVGFLPYMARYQTRQPLQA